MGPEAIEFRAFEFRALETGTIEGTVIPYGQPATIGDFTERFIPGSITIGDVIANRQHDRHKPLARLDGGGLTLTDSATELRARIELPDTSDGRDVRELIKRGVLRGLSAEFRARRESWEGSERTIHEADLVGLAVVDRGAYAGATVAEVREAIEHLRSCAPSPAMRAMLWPSV